MDSPLSRRRLLHVSTLAIIPASGCLDVGVGGQPEEIPLEVENQSNQTRTLSVEFFESDTGDVLLSEAVELESDDAREFEVGPIGSQTRYTVSYEMGDESGEYPVSGSGLRGVQVQIREDGSIEVYHTVT